MQLLLQCVMSTGSQHICTHIVTSSCRKQEPGGMPTVGYDEYKTLDGLQ